MTAVLAPYTAELKVSPCKYSIFGSAIRSNRRLSRGRFGFCVARLLIRGFIDRQRLPSRTRRALEVKLTLEINSLTRHLNLRRNVSLRLKPNNSSCLVPGVACLAQPFSDLRNRIPDLRMNARGMNNAAATPTKMKTLIRR